MVLHGVSIGCGVAVPLAASRPVKGLILESPFTSLADAAHSVYPFLPCGLLLRDRYDNLGTAPRVACPVLLLHGTEDEIVPVEQGRRLAAAFPRPAKLVLAEGARHNDVAFWPGYDPAIAEFLRSLP
jgi:pimeloyl-ACP methyl ester carboxylesterase